MKINLLGWVSLRDDGVGVPLVSRQARTLLALLALEPGRSLSADYLVDQLWSDAELGNARNALQANITRLRRALRAGLGTERGDALLQTVEGGYRLALRPEEVDVFAFVGELREAEMLGRGDPVRATHLIDTALARWQGSALDGVSDAPALRAERVRLTERRTTALELQAGLRLEAGDVRSAIADLTHLVEMHHERENLNELLMMALYLDGRQTEALDVFRRVRNRLRNELGVDPSHRLNHLHQAILSHDPKLSRRFHRDAPVGAVA
ncbi:AfsR/SARP family transcriptional regulator [Flexivirga meconopsidis]|uniref:AfsR/SARP family transcriptional regulator n=1 Tax=Flexivirga meconopsidis TaxID=2977121 RepID=UPI0022403E67|nr:AfsR/SARP family transcriptional regulator [Flexivirga meconopsidis]